MFRPAIPGRSILGSFSGSFLGKFGGKSAMSSARVLEGKVALVTAGTAGIGLAVSEALGAAGAQVFLSSRKSQNVQKAVELLRGKGLQVSGTTCHVGDAKSREEMVKEALRTFGAIDILVSNAAVNPHFGSALDADQSVWDKVFQVNVTAAAMLVRLVVPYMERRGGGAIVLTSSIAGYQPMALWEDEAVKEKALEALGAQRLGSPHDVAQAVLFLVSPKSSFVAGETLVVAGGARSRL